MKEFGRSLVMIADVVERPVEEVLLFVELVAEEGAAEVAFDLALAGDGVLPAVEALGFDDLVDVGDDAADDLGGGLDSALLEDCGEGLLAVGDDLLLGFSLGVFDVFGCFEEGLQPFDAVEKTALVFVAEAFETET